MTANDLDGLRTRLDRLERQNRWLKRGGAALLVLLGTGLLLAAQDKPKPRPTATNRLSLTDADGNERGYVHATVDGLGVVFTAGGGPRSCLLLNSQGAVAQLLDGDGKPVSGASVESRGVAIGFRSSTVGNDAGTTAIRDIVGNALTPSPLVGKPERK